VESRHSRRLEEVAAAEKFIAWQTNKDYTKLVAAKEGWANVPPGTRTSLYQNPEYLKVAPFAKLTLASIDAADPNKPTVQPVPYVGVQYAAIPEFQGIATTVGQQFSAATIRFINGRSGARGGAIVHRTRNEAQAAISSRALSNPAAISSRSVANWLPSKPDTGRTAALIDFLLDIRRRRWQLSKPQVLGRALLTPGVALLFIWMIVPLAMTIYFSTLHYNLLDPENRGLRRAG